MRYYDEISAYLDGVYCKELSAVWDHDGEMVFCDALITRVLVALDATTPAINFARKNGCQLIITHHPLLFKKPYPIDVIKRVAMLKKYGIGLLSYHTRLDEADGGVNDCLCKALGFVDFKRMGDCGRIAETEPMTVCELADTVKTALGVQPFVVDCGNVIRRVGLVGGAGKDEIIKAKYVYGCDAFITGEANHSSHIAAHETGISLICATHHATERVVLPALAETVKSRFKDIETTVFDFNEDIEYGV